MNGAAKIVLEAGDRVVVSVDGEARKARVVSTADTLVFVTFKKGDEPQAFDRSAVYALYRYVDGPFGKGVLPLFFEKNA